MAISEDISFIDQTGSTMLFYTPVCISTQKTALQCAEANIFKLPFALYTLDQKQGRGQQNRTWISEPGQNLALTFAAQLKKSDNLVQLNKALSLACLNCIHILGAEDAKIKWPNDIRVNEAKLAGILMESSPLKNETLVLCGIGVNVNQTHFSGMDQKAASVGQITGKNLSIAEVALLFCRELDKALTDFKNSAPGVDERFNSNLEGLGENWTVQTNTGETFTAELLGSDEFGRVKLRFNHNQTDAFHHGTIRLTQKI